MRKDVEAACLEVVLGLTRGGQPARARDIAENMDVRPSAAATMVRDLLSERLVVKTAGGGVALTEAGRALALTVARRHRLLEAFLVEDLGMDARQAHREARAVEQDIPAEAAEQVCEFLARIEPRKPGGGPDAAQASGPGPDALLRPLSDLEEDEAGRIRVVIAGRDTRHDLMSLGFLPGVEVSVRRKLRTDSVLVRVKDAEIAIGRNVARGILLAPAGRP